MVEQQRTSLPQGLERWTEQRCTINNRRNYKLCHAVIECCFAVCEAHSFYPPSIPNSKHFYRSRICLLWLLISGDISLCIITAWWSHWQTVTLIFSLVCWVIIILLPCWSNKWTMGQKYSSSHCWMWIIWMITEDKTLGWNRDKQN